jgi:hypothetical protein
MYNIDKFPRRSPNIFSEYSFCCCEKACDRCTGREYLRIIGAHLLRSPVAGALCLVSDGP